MDSTEDKVDIGVVSKILDALTNDRAFRDVPDSNNLVPRKPEADSDKE